MTGDTGIRQHTFARICWSVLRIVIVVACITFLVVQIREVLDQTTLVEWLPAGAVWFAVLAALPIMATAWLLALGWKMLLQARGHHIHYLPLVRILFVTQIAKYLPGNVGHHVGRVALAKRSLAVPAGDSIATLLQEGALLCLGATVVALICMLLQPTTGHMLPVIGMPILWVTASILTLGLAALAVLNQARRSSRLASVRGLGWLMAAVPDWHTTRKTIGVYSAVNVLNGAGMVLIAWLLVDDPLHAALPLTAAFALSWVVGFVVPGAPGGLGVREAALVLLLESTLPKESVLAIALMSRVSTTIADMAIFIAGITLASLTRKDHPR